MLKLLNLGNLLNIKLANSMIHADKKYKQIHIQQFTEYYDSLVFDFLPEQDKKPIDKIDDLFRINNGK